MKHPIIAIIGAGHMGSSLISGLINNGYPPHHIWATDVSEATLSQIKALYQIHTTQDKAHALKHATVVIFAVKPQFFAEVAHEVAPIVRENKPLILSIAAGIRIASIQKWLGEHLSIVRTMPNTPALLGCGATALFATPSVTIEERDLAESILRAVGITIWVHNESLLDVVTALSGSGPAYFFLMMESLQEAAEVAGLPTDTARILTLQTALGAARMAIESKYSLAELRQQVTSKGGTTEKAVSVLEKQGIRPLFDKALQAAIERSQELAEKLGDTP